MKFNGVKKTIRKYKQGSLDAKVGKKRWSRSFSIYRLDKCGDIEMNINIVEDEIDDVIAFFKANRNFKHKRKEIK